MLDDIAARDDVEGPGRGRNRRKMPIVEAGLPAFQIWIASLGWCDIERERASIATARRKPVQQRLLERAGTEGGAGARLQGQQLFYQRVEMALRFAVADPGHLR